MPHTLSIRESAETEPVSIDDAAVDALTRLGRRLASQKAWWGEVEDDREACAIRCIPAAGGLWRIRVDNAVGVFSVAGTQVAVQPKIPLPHLLHLLAASGALPRLDDTPTTIAPDATLWELVATWFVAASEDVLRKGLVRDYQVAREDLAIVRGRVHPRSTATNFYRGRLRFDCEYEEFDIDTPLNRIVLAAARTIAGSQALGLDLRRKALAVTVHMDEGVDEWTSKDMGVSLDRRTHHYRDVLPLAKHILRHSGRTLSHGQDIGWSFLFPTPALVEEAIRRIMARALAPWTVAKRATQLDNSTLTFNPDLVFGDRDAIGDVKYKLTAQSWNRADLYEVVAFATAFRANDACVVTFQDAAVPTPLQQLMVGDVRVSNLVWPADETISPKDAEDMFIAQVREWAAHTSADAVAITLAG